MAVEDCVLSLATFSGHTFAGRLVVLMIEEDPPSATLLIQENQHRNASFSVYELDVERPHIRVAVDLAQANAIYEVLIAIKSLTPFPQQVSNKLGSYYFTLHAEGNFGETMFHWYDKLPIGWGTLSPVVEALNLLADDVLQQPPAGAV